MSERVLPVSSFERRGMAGARRGHGVDADIFDVARVRSGPQRFGAFARLGRVAVFLALAVLSVQSGCSLNFPCVKVCGNGKMECEDACDDGNLVDGDGCDSQCHVEQGWACPLLLPNVGTTCRKWAKSATGPTCPVRNVRISIGARGISFASIAGTIFRTAVNRFQVKQEKQHATGVVKVVVFHYTHT